MSTTRQAETASRWRAPVLFAIIAALFIAEGTLPSALFSGSWNTALAILNMGLISAVTALGVNMIWGYAGLFSTGIVGSVALGGLAVALISSKPVPEGWAAGGPRIFGALLFAAVLHLGQQLQRRGAAGAEPESLGCHAGNMSVDR